MDGFNCLACTKSYSSRGALKRHKDSVHLNVRHACNCGKSYVRFEDYRRHYTKCIAPLPFTYTSQQSTTHLDISHIQPQMDNGGISTDGEPKQSLYLLNIKDTFEKHFLEFVSSNTGLITQCIKCEPSNTTLNNGGTEVTINPTPQPELPDIPNQEIDDILLSLGDVPDLVTPVEPSIIDLFMQGGGLDFNEMNDYVCGPN